MEKEHTLAKASEKLEFIDNLTGALKEKENQYKEVTEKLLQAEHNVRNEDLRFLYVEL